MMTPLLNNRYRILQALGKGGFGETFLAEDTQMPSLRRCVIKQLKPVTNNPQLAPEVQQRFAREAAILEDLGEGNAQLPKLYAYFESGGQFYLVQEWIEGATLTQKVESQGKLAENEVKEILISLLPVLDYVHNKRMVHRDIKPDNIILRKRDSKPVLIDFGAVKEAMGTVVNAQGNAVSSMVIGTPGYMPSEQGIGRPTYSSDLYSLGLTAVYLLTGKSPQELQTDSRTGEILWRQDAPNLHSDLASVIDRVIRLNPGDRYSTAIEMLNALQSPATSAVVTQAISPPQPAAVVTQAISPPQPTAVINPTPVIKQGNKKPIIVGVIVASVLLGAGIAFGSIRNWLSQPRQPVTQQPNLPTQSPSPTPTSTPTTVVESPSPTPTKAVESPLSPSPTPTKAVESPSPEFTPSPALPESPSPVHEESPRNDNPPVGIKTFSLGTSESEVKAALGEPTKITRGLWNTRAVLYENYIPEQVSLGYLFDNNTGNLRQTEASFAQSVERGEMQKALNGMLGGRTSKEVRQGLTRVYQRRSNQYSFETDRVKGIIQRNKFDRVYIGVWDADLH